MKISRHITRLTALAVMILFLVQSGLTSFAAESISVNPPSVEDSLVESKIDASDAKDADDAGNVDDADDIGDGADHGELLDKYATGASEGEIARRVTPAPADIRTEGETAKTAPKLAPAGIKQVDARVTELTIKSLSGNTVDHVYWSDKFYLAMDWDASSNGADLHEGDYFDITLPEKMIFPSDHEADNFNIYGEDGTTVIGKAHVTPGTGDKGGSVRITFTDWVEGKENVRGSIRLSARFDKEQITIGKDNTFEISVSGKVVPVTVRINGPTALEPEILGKWGQSVDGEKQQAEWYIRINHQKADLRNVVITDHLSEGAGTETYIAESFMLRPVEFNEYGDVVRAYDEVSLTGKLDIAANGKSFTLNLGDIHDGQYRLRYRTTYTPGTTLRNNMKLTSAKQVEVASASHISADSGGSGTGNLANKIKLIKVDADDQSLPLANAVFEVTRPDGTSFEMITGADGTAVSGYLTSGTYQVKEKSAPDGYELNREEFSMVVSSAGGALQTVPDKKKKTDPETISIPIVKFWNGGYLLRAASRYPVNNQDEGSSENRPASVTVNLLADGTVIRTVELNESNGWALMLSGFPKYGNDGHEIQYTVNEVGVPGYTTTITGDPSTGFIITNTATTQVKVIKKWVGPARDSATLHLLADGRTKETVTLNAGNDWIYTFGNLQKYDSSDGHEIVYSISEIPVDGYSSVISGTAKDGYTMTNTITGKISIPVTKVWSGGTGSKAIVHLFADGNEIASQELNSGNQWQYTFENLDKYKDGKEISYTLTEDGIPGYSAAITYSTERGFTVTNTKEPSGHHGGGGGGGGGHGDGHHSGGGSGVAMVTVVGTKSWEDNNNDAGTRPSLITLHLLANGTEIATAQTSADFNWTYSFGRQPLCDAGGKEISYMVTEDAVSGYSFSQAAPVTADGKIVINVRNILDPTTKDTNGSMSTNEGSGGRKTAPNAGTKVSGSVATSDDSRMMLYLFLMIGSLIVLAADLIFLRRQEEAGK